jgi:hypothetical protein
MTKIYALQNNVVFKPTAFMEKRQQTGSINEVLVSCNGLRKVSKNFNNVFEKLFSTTQQPANNIERPNNCVDNARWHDARKVSHH